MKSNFFKKDSLNTNQIETLKKITKLSNEQIEKLISWFNGQEIKPTRLISTTARHEFYSKLNDLCVDCQIEFDDVIEIHRLITDLGYWLVYYDDNVNDLVEDFQSQGYLEDAGKEITLKLLDSTSTKAREFAIQARRTSYESAEIPSLTKVTYSTDLRLIPKKNFEQLGIQIENYEPKGEELATIAIIRLTTDEQGPVKSFVFQLNFAELEDLIVKLQACQKELRLMETVAKKIDFSK